jgi:glycosyltransferase involved in cell wall biosynthesis
MRIKESKENGSLFSENNYTNILFVSSSASFGGAQQCLLDLMANLPIYFNPIVILPRKGRFLDKVIESNIKYYLIPSRGWWYSRFRIKCLERLANNLFAIGRIFFTVKSLKIKLVYTNTLYSPVGACVAKLLKVPHIWHVHEFTHLNYIQKFDFGLKRSMSFVNKNSDILICPSDSSKTDLSTHIPSEKIRFVHNGIELLDQPEQILHNVRSIHEDQEFKILIIGTIIDFKGQVDAILAIAELIKNRRKVKLLIIGDGEKKYVDYLKRMADKIGVSNIISWEGHQNDVNEYILSASLLYVCSKYETFGMVIIEAMSKGCPVIASRTGGILEIIEHGKNGFLYDCGDIKSLVETTELLITNKKLYSTISKNSFLTCQKNFSRSKYVGEIVTIIHETIFTA